MSLLNVLWCVVRSLLVALAFSGALPGCQQPNVTTPTQAGGHHNRQQVGGTHATVPVTVAPSITVDSDGSATLTNGPATSQSAVPD